MLLGTCGTDKTIRISLTTLEDVRFQPILPQSVQICNPGESCTNDDDVVVLNRFASICSAVGDSLWNRNSCHGEILVTRTIMDKLVKNGGNEKSGTMM